MNHLAENWSLINPNSDKMHFDLVAGISVGSLNGGMIAMDKLEELNQIWRQVADNGVEEVYTSDLIDTESESETPRLKADLSKLKDRLLPNLKIKIDLWKGLGMFLNKKKQVQFFEDVMKSAGQELKNTLCNFKSLADNTPLREKLAQHFDKDAIENCKFLCGFVSLDEGEYHAVAHDEFTSNEDFINGVLASTAMPIVWEPTPAINFLQKQARNAVDGGIRNVSPLGDIITEINKDPDPDVEYFVIVINCANGQIDTQDFSKCHIAEIALRSLNDIAITEIFNSDLSEFVRINDLVRQVKDRDPSMQLFHYSFADNRRTLQPLKAFKTLIIQPSPGVIGNTLACSKAIIDRRMQHGRQKAENALQQFTGMDRDEFLLAVA